jgi:hypothetical protein
LSLLLLLLASLEHLLEELELCVCEGEEEEGGEEEGDEDACHVALLTMQHNFSVRIYFESKQRPEIWVGLEKTIQKLESKECEVVV